MIPVQKTPSKKIIYLAGGALLVVIGIFIYRNHSADSVLGKKTLSYEAGDLSDRELREQMDTDSDGLSDYQETDVWQTDPSNPDTDGDSTSDGEEIDLGRDPYKPGPDDILLPGDPRIKTAIKTTISSDSSTNGNQTENLSKNFFTAYLSAQDQNGGVSGEDGANLIQNAILNVSAPQPVQKYTLGSLSVVDPSSKEDIKAYGNSFASVVKNDYASYSKIQEPTYQQSAEFYQNLSKDLATLRVPSGASTLHLQIINGYNQMYVALMDLNSYENDPLKGALAIQTFQNNQNIVPTFYQKLVSYFKNNGIIFTKDDAGFTWNNF